MLQSLELNGFKSFADRTRFEFPKGITVVVGPNGSGKSNVVDAIKWVLGTQSVKALRGKEMTDVIFSGTAHRNPSGVAEVSLFFDNSDQILGRDEAEVQVTRRVYRSGEGEYLINRQPCRLRDIRDLFAGTGVAGGAYSIIEQGKVDALLQSSPRERRLIFEEAAGVSRFKLKRQEADRRLQRVEQNLLRLSDILGELDSRLHGVRSQAGKARKYKEHADRLQQLRTQVGLQDWRRLTNALEKFKRQVGEKQAACQQLAEQVDQSDQAAAKFDQQSEQYQKNLQETSGQATSAREQIAQCEATRRSQLARSDELQQESQRLQQQLLTMTSRVGDAQQLVADTTAQLEAAEQQFDLLDGRADQQQSELDEAQQELATLREAAEQCRTEHTTAFQRTTHLQHDIERLKSQQESSIAAISRWTREAQQLEETRNQLADQLSQAEQNLKESTAATELTASRMNAARDKLQRDRADLAESHRQLADLQGRLTGARERAVVLEELERRLDGLSAGAKDVLRQAREEPDGPFGGVRGVVADLLHVDADMAPLVEIALGQQANHLAMQQTDRLFEHYDALKWEGRTGFLRLDVPAPASAVDRLDLSAEPGVIGRADQFVETNADLSTLPRRLLGRHWFVDTLATAVRLSSGLGRGLNFVTADGEVVAADGTLVVGPRQSATGLLSRRSELRALVDEVDQMQNQIQQRQTACAQLEKEITRNEGNLQQITARHTSLAEQLNESRLHTSSLSHRLEQVTEQHATAFQEQTTAQQAQQASQSQQQQYEQEIVACRNHLRQIEEQLQHSTTRSAKLEQQVAVWQKTVADDRVALARSEQRRDGLRLQMGQLRRDHEERDRAMVETRERVVQCQHQRKSLEKSVLDLSSELAEVYRTKESLTENSQQFQQKIDQLRSNRLALTGQLESLRKNHSTAGLQLQQVKLELLQRTQQRDELATHTLEDYQINLAELHVTLPDASFAKDLSVENRQAADEEIRHLRRELQSIGPVNLEALSELDALQDRHESLDSQMEDLQTAKARLEQLVQRINTESRELFVHTLETIRGHFQELYRSLFGGGEADIVMEEGENTDVLECGIEVTARPPGKQLRNISLLSGGERTLTCVALLLAIFRSRPSPFCVLDEVDAALDEANVERFVQVLKEFMKNTQFIVITHSKRTMACCDTLYGVTMQESGISKRVSVRFEDVSADGHIRPSAEGRQAA